MCLLFRATLYFNCNQKLPVFFCVFVTYFVVVVLTFDCTLIGVGVGGLNYSYYQIGIIFTRLIQQACLHLKACCGDARIYIIVLQFSCLLIVSWCTVPFNPSGPCPDSCLLSLCYKNNCCQ